MAARLLLLVNTTSGTGQATALVERLRAILDAALGRERFEVACVADHAAASRAAEEFVARTPGRCAVVAGGGNGTVRAAVEGISAALGPAGGERVALAALRLGSGNVFARHFGAPADPEAALRGILEHLRAERLARCVLLRCDVEHADGRRRTLLATSLVGFGAFGEVPADLARWHGAHPSLHRLAARLLGLERLTRLEYGVAFALRVLRDAVSPGGGHALRVRLADGDPGATLSAGAVAKYDFDALPLRSGLRAVEPAMALALLDRLPLAALLRGLLRPRRLARGARLSVLARGETVRLEARDGEPAPFFVDEDPDTFDRALTVRLSHALPVVPGPDYRWPAAVPQEVAP